MTLDDTRALVRRLFEGVTDKGGRPYHEHCERVEAFLPAEATEDERHAALLHEVIEDTGTTSADLLGLGYSARTVHLVERLSRKPEDGPYLDWIGSVAASGDRGLILIKLADNRDNGDPARIAALPPERRDISGRYALARALLVAALETAR